MEVEFGSVVSPVCILVTFLHRGLGWPHLTSGPRGVLAVVEVNLQRDLCGGCFSPSPLPNPNVHDTHLGSFHVFSSVVFSTSSLELNRSRSRASAEGVHGTVFLLVEKVLLHPYEESIKSEIKLL